MAPRMHRDYYSTGDSCRYSLRTLKHCENNFLYGRDVDVSKVNGKEDFFRCIGLQMRKFQYQYKTPNSGHRIKWINIPHGVMLRDCRVVIPGSTCELCGKCFKCKTDLNGHIALEHRNPKHNAPCTATKGTQYSRIESKLCGKSPKDFHRATTVPDRSFETKLQKKICVTFRIGKEVVAKMSVKKKHLKVNTVDTCTQTELYNESDLILNNSRHDIVASRIDPAAFDNSPYRCHNSTLRRVNSPNRYLVSDIVASKQTIGKEGAVQEESHKSQKSNDSCAQRLSKERSVARDINLLEKNNVGDCITDEFSFSQLKNTLTLNEASRDHRELNYCKSNINSLTKNNPLGRIVQSDSRDSTELGKGKDINANTIENYITIREKEGQSRSASKTVQLIVPVILPIIVPNKSEAMPPIKLTIQSTSLLPQQEQGKQSSERREEPREKELARQEEELSGQEETRRGEESQQGPNTLTMNVEDKDNEIKEVLRIVRGRSISTEINHESPNRLEQKILVQDAIRDMKRMEEEGWHLLQNGSVKPSKKRKRSMRSNLRSTDVNEECVRSKTNFGNNLVRNSTIEKYISDKREQALKAQNYDVAVRAGDILKENLMTCNANANIPVEVLHQYGINCDNDVFEINNNVQSTQEPVNYFPVSCSGGMESRSNRPTVIDLVNDADE